RTTTTVGAKVVHFNPRSILIILIPGATIGDRTGTGDDHRAGSSIAAAAPLDGEEEYPEEQHEDEGACESVNLQCNKLHSRVRLVCRRAGDREKTETEDSSNSVRKMLSAKA